MSKEKEIPLEKFAVNAIQVLRMIPDNLLADLAKALNVDHYTKVLTGERMFYLLVYAFIRSDRTSQRKLEDYFSHPAFQALFNIASGTTVRHSSISARLKTIDVTFFERSFELIYNRLSTICTKDEMASRKIIRIDSSMVTEACNKLMKGIQNGSKSSDSNKKRQVKYTMAFDGFAPKKCEVLTSQEDASEDVAMPKVLMPLIQKDKDHCNIYTLDRGLSSLANYKAVDEADAEFVGRIKLNRKMEIVKVLTDNNSDHDLDTLELIDDCIVHFYDGKEKKWDDTEFRVITARYKKPHSTSRSKKDVADTEIRFVTNNMTLSAKEITDTYKKRWDIEVFFRFLKQELNFSHFLSTNENGLKVILYMTMITSMLIMMYKKLNGIGYKRAKWCFDMQLEHWVCLYTSYIQGGDYCKSDIGRIFRVRIT